ncbi:hypothetical protein ENBRE01_2698 [Enteropsectra breve]|nr:hypothetical protein ENBRE01_2229 [Enteropsectra breve]KAI5152270.1 hypothetical protein ENBRE01_2698 [Enteropsectra breve]
MITAINTDNNAKDAKNMLDTDDDVCWFSNGGKNPRIEIELDGSDRVLIIEFQKGFQPKNLNSSSEEEEISVKKEDSIVRIEKLTNIKNIILTLGDSYDPYNRICIYSIRAE